MVYDILLGGESIGKAEVAREGLYYRFFCRCRFSGEVMHRITVRCGDRTESLGIPVPQDGAFQLSTRIPVKRIGEGELEFRAVPKRPERQGRFIPLKPEEPFAYLRRLEDAVLETRDGQVGIVLRGL